MTKGADDQMVFSFFENRTVVEFYEQIFVQNIHCDGSYTSTGELINNTRPIYLFPNPVNTNNLQLEFTANFPVNQANVDVYTTTGVCVKTIKLDIQKGWNSLQIPVDGLRSGMYFITINRQGGARFIKT